jgi:hypothetical protein
LAIKKETIKISFDAISKIDTKDMHHGVSKPNLAKITEQITKFFFPIPLVTFCRKMIGCSLRAKFPVFSKIG